MCHFVPPAEAENPLQTANVEGFEGCNVATAQDRGFTSIQQYRDTDSIVNCNFFVYVERLRLKKNTLGKTAEGS